MYLNGSTVPVDTYVDSTFAAGQVGLYDDQPNTTAGGYGPPTTFTNFYLAGTAVPPGIKLFSPGDGKVGSAVRIVGLNLQWATAVTFNGIAASFKQEYPSTDIVAIVPELATTGPIAVTTPIGAGNQRQQLHRAALTARGPQ